MLEPHGGKEVPILAFSYRREELLPPLERGLSEGGV
jgi:hypothetical protein